VQELVTQHPGVLIAMLAFSFAEWVWARWIARRSYDARASLASVGVALGQALLKPVTAVVIAGTYSAATTVAITQFPVDKWQVWFAGFFAVEFAYYWFHRWSHSVNWVWATHAVHHSANEMTLPAAIRLGWTGVISGGWLVFLPLILIGFPPKMVGALLAINLLYQFGLHTEAIRKLGPLEWILNTPSHHRAHHASDEPWLDCNFGGVLIVFDRMFGTFVAEPVAGGLRYGLTEPIQSRSPIKIAFHQWCVLFRAMRLERSPASKARLAFGRPAALHTMAKKTPI
jgi:sterol desaturase/sphingolipid hydroxylase (fatty acid hydroxylase superfamily)